MKMEGRSLTSCAISPDGGSIRLGFLDAEGVPCHLDLPVEQAGAVAMTLPSLIEKAMRARFNDASLRYAHPLSSWALEQSTDPDTLMMTLRTPDGFSVCFSMRGDQGDALSATLSQPQAPAISPALN